MRSRLLVQFALALLIPAFFLSDIGFGQNTAKLVRKLALSDSHISGLAIHPTNSQLFVYVNAAGVVTLSDLSTGKSLWAIKGLSPLQGHEVETVLNISAFSSDGKYISIGRSSQPEILVLRTIDGTVIRRIVDKESKSPGILGAQFSNEGRSLLLSHWRERAMSAWEIVSGRQTARLQEPPPVGSIFAPSPSYSLATLPNSQLMVDVYSHGTRIWNLKSGIVQKRMSAPRLDPFSNPAMISGSIISSDGRLAAIFLTDSGASNSKPSYALAIQNNESGKIEAITRITVPGNQFHWLEADFQKFIVRGFAAGSFFSWNARLREPPKVTPAQSPWLNENFGWPTFIPFQGHSIADASQFISIIDVGVFGIWKIPN